MTKLQAKEFKNSKIAKPIKLIVANQLYKVDIARYKKWLKLNSITHQELLIQKGQAKQLKYQPSISIIVPVYNTPETFFVEMIESVFNQTYENWEIVLVDDASPDQSIRDLIETYAKKERRVKYLFLEKNHHISEATNQGIKIAKGEFISLLDHDDKLLPNALFEIVKVLNKEKEIDFIYTDEDKITEDGRIRMQPFFKPNWNPDLLHSINYITHFTTIRKTLLDKVGYEDGQYNGAQDWELFLRATRSLRREKVYHIPYILYSWRVHDQSTAKRIETKSYVVNAQRNAINDDLKHRGYTKFQLHQDELYSAQWQVSFSPSSKHKVSIVITNPLVAKQATLETQQNTSYLNYKIEVNQSPNTLKDILDDKTSDYIVFIDRQLSINDQNWIENMLGDAERPEIGFVLARVDARENLKNASEIIDKSAHLLLPSLSRLAFTKHVYRTTRYNITSINKGIVMVQTSKLSKVIKGNINYTYNLNELSTSLTNLGYFNLYNPYIKI